MGSNSMVQFLALLMIAKYRNYSLIFPRWFRFSFLTQNPLVPGLVGTFSPV